MFLLSSEQLVRDQPTLAALIGQIDACLAEIGTGGDIVPADLAHLLSADEARVRNVLDELARLGGLERQERVFCPQNCSAITVEEYQEACDEGAPPQCPECDSRLERSPRRVFRLTVNHRSRRPVS